MAPLNNAKHEAFARAIVEGASGREAYRTAGYTAKARAADANASRLLATANVAARVAELKGAAAQTSVVTAQRVLDELAKIGFANMADYMRAGPDGDPVLDFSRLTRDQAAALVEVTVEDFKDGRGEGARDVRRVKFKLGDKRAALVDLGNHLGLFKQRVELGGVDGKPIETKDASEPNDLARRIAFILARTVAAKPVARKPEGKADGERTAEVDGRRGKASGRAAGDGKEPGPDQG